MDGHALTGGPQSPLSAKSSKLAEGLGSSARLQAKLKDLAIKVKQIKVQSTPLDMALPVPKPGCGEHTIQP